MCHRAQCRARTALPAGLLVGIVRELAALPKNLLSYRGRREVLTKESVLIRLLKSYDRVFVGGRTCERFYAGISATGGTTVSGADKAELQELVKRLLPPITQCASREGPLIWARLKYRMCMRTRRYRQRPKTIAINTRGAYRCRKELSLISFVFPY